LDEFLDFIDDAHPQIYHKLRESGELEPDTEELLKKAITEFKERFVAVRKPEEEEVEEKQE
jgi:F0F1-type ATP synthase alpha subunit